MKEDVPQSLNPRMHYFARADAVRFYQTLNDARGVFSRQTKFYEMYYLHDRPLDNSVTTKVGYLLIHAV